MFYVFHNTTEKTRAIAELADKENALEFMEYQAMRDGNPSTLGYFVEDGTGTRIAEYEL